MYLSFFEDDMDIYFLRQLVSERLTTVDIPNGWGGKPTLGPNTTGLGQVFLVSTFRQNKEVFIKRD